MGDSLSQQHKLKTKFTSQKNFIELIYKITFCRFEEIEELIIEFLTPSQISSTFSFLNYDQSIIFCYSESASLEWMYNRLLTKYKTSQIQQIFEI